LIVIAYLLRDIDDNLWARVKARAKADGHNMRWVLLRLLQAYDERGLPKVGK
jgi:hypothetical protein